MIGCGNFGEKESQSWYFHVCVCTHACACHQCMWNCACVGICVLDAYRSKLCPCAHVSICAYNSVFELLDTQMCACICACVFLGMYVYVCEHIQVPNVLMFSACVHRLIYMHVCTQLFRYSYIQVCMFVCKVTLQICWYPRKFILCILRYIHIHCKCVCYVSGQKVKRSCFLNT